MSILFAMAVIGSYVYITFFEGTIYPSYFSFGCICACFLLSLIFVKWEQKKVYITLALALTILADYFLVLAPSAENKMFGLYVFCGVQFFYMLYTMCLNKGNGLKVLNMAIRVGLSLLAYFLLNHFFDLGTMENIAVIYIINSFVTLVWLLFHIKTEWLVFIGFLLFFICDVYIGLMEGALAFFNVTGPVLEFLLKYNIAGYTYIPGILLISLGCVWAKPRRK